VKHLASTQFWLAYRKLPASVRKLARKNFKLLKGDVRHPSLHLKKLDSFWSVRIGQRHRALAVQTKEALIWFWIGSHSDYDKLINP
jgi:hypothetical protein